MAIRLTRLLPLSRRLTKNPRHLASYLITKRYVQEFPDLKLDNKLPKDYLVILPESLSKEVETNELIKITKQTEKELDFSKLNPENVYKGLSYFVGSFENYVADVNDDTLSLDQKSSLEEIFKEIEKDLYPMDTAYNILSALINVDSRKYEHAEIFDLLRRYYKVRESRFFSNFRKTMQIYNIEKYDQLSDVDKRLLDIYYPRCPGNSKIKRELEVAILEYNKHLNNEIKQFRENLRGADRLFKHTIDDPDILASVSSEFPQCQDLHHKERTPLIINMSSYQRFMQVCPDRFVRQNLWQVKNKRCSPKAYTKYNNISIINAIRVYRKKIAHLCGFRSHLELKMKNAMANSKQDILDSLECLNNDNQVLLRERLQELNDYAYDNAFHSSNQTGLGDSDINFWSHKYIHEILVGKTESELREFFPLPKVLTGIRDYFHNYFGIELKQNSGADSKLWARDVSFYEVTRNKEPIGSLIHDPYFRETKSLSETFVARLRSKNKDLGYLPMRLISTSYFLDNKSGQAQLSIKDVIDLFFCYAMMVQRLLYNYKYAELNSYGALEVDSNDLFPYYCVAQLLTDHRVLQSCSQREDSKPIDSGTARRIQNAATYFSSLKRWHDLYKARLDLEAHSSLTDIRTLQKEIVQNYSPFEPYPDNYDYCAMADVFAGGNDGVQYKELWSKQLANYCLSSITSKLNQEKDMSSIEVNTIREFNSKLVQTLFDPENLNTKNKLKSLTGVLFEPSKTGLGVL